MVHALLSYDEPTRIPARKPAKQQPQRKRTPRKTREIKKPLTVEETLKREVQAEFESFQQELLQSARDGIRGEEKPDTTDIDMLVRSLQMQTPTSDTYNKDEDAEQANTWLRT